MPSKIPVRKIKIAQSKKLLKIVNDILDRPAKTNIRIVAKLGDTPKLLKYLAIKLITGLNTLLNLSFDAMVLN